MVSLREMYRRVYSGPLVTQKDFFSLDHFLHPLQALAKEYGITRDPNDYVPTDPGMADNLFQAGMAFLESSGFDVHDMGTEVPPLKFIDKAHEVHADIIAASALMSQTMPVQRDLITILTERGLREKYKVMVGGAPTTAQWAEEIGADGWGEEVGDAVKKAKELVGAD